MGWTYGWGSKAQLLDHLRKPAPQNELVDEALNGSEFYLLLRAKATGKRFIVLCVVKSAKGEWGYKDFEEVMGPCYYRCPERILAQSDCDDPSAVAWRESCRKARAKPNNRALLASLKPGDEFTCKGLRIKFTRRMSPRGKEIFCGIDPRDGYEYRWPKSRIMA